MFSSNLQKIRKYFRISQEEMSNKTNTTYRAYTSYERGDRNPSLELIKNLNENLGINLNWYFTGEGLMFRNECKNTHVLIKNEKPVENFKSWGKRLSKILAENEETPYDFAKRTGIKESRIESFILDSVEPTISEINSIKSNVDVSIDELLYGESVQKNTQTDNISLSADEILKIKKLLNQSNI